jgi:hypothetical protein
VDNWEERFWVASSGSARSAGYFPLKVALGDLISVCHRQWTGNFEQLNDGSDAVVSVDRGGVEIMHLPWSVSRVAGWEFQLHGDCGQEGKPCKDKQAGTRW